MSTIPMTVEQAEERCGVHRQTLANALRAGELHGAQRTTRGTWRIREECLVAWLMVEPCEHQASKALVA